MYFTDRVFFLFLLLVFTLHWALPRTWQRNAMLLCASYVFYGWVHPWFCILLGITTTVDFVFGLLIEQYPRWKKHIVWTSVATNIGMLAWFKYFNFFVENFEALTRGSGLDMDPILVRMFLPVGISFYTFQSMSYTIDVYRGHQRASRNLMDFALYVSFFPQLVAGPIERANHLLPQLVADRKWNWTFLTSAVPLLVRGYLKKVVVADNISVYADRGFAMEQPTAMFLIVCTLAFTLQILADWTGYTDIARGTARLFGVNLTENFRTPFLSVTLPEYWRRWHISFGTWLRDYVLIPLGGTRCTSELRNGFNIVITMAISGIWHGAAWNYLVWGLLNGFALWGYRLLGMRGNWRPKHWYTTLLSWCVVFLIVNIGHCIARSPSLGWLINAVSDMQAGLRGDSMVASMVVISVIALYSLPMFLFLYLDRWAPPHKWLHALFYGVCILIILFFHQDTSRDFYYFQF